MTFPFLTARWTNLCLLTYTVPPDLLKPRLPPGLDLEIRDGHAFVSVVAFQFLDTRVLGVPWPGYRNFAELNLRFYVRHGSERGVVFIREFVPQRLVAFLARAIYNEPYLAAPVTHTLREHDGQVTAECHLTWPERTHRLSVTGRAAPFQPGEATDEHFFKEHHWGFGIDRRGRTIRYQVDHPLWQVFPVVSHEVDFDFPAVYGKEWKILDGKAPFSVVFAVGSAIAVHPKGKMR